MSCALCGGEIRLGQFFVTVRAFTMMRGRQGCRHREAEPMDMEDGANSKAAHYGCVLKRCPELIGVGGMPDDRPLLTE